MGDENAGVILVTEISVKCVYSVIVRYETEFGFILDNKKVVVDDIRVRGIGSVMSNIEDDIEQAVNPPIVDKV